MLFDGIIDCINLSSCIHPRLSEKESKGEKKEAVKQTQSHEIHISVLNVMRGDRFHAALHCCTLWQLSALRDPQCSGF